MDKKNIFKYAFIKSIPIMCSYLFVSMAYGILMEEAGVAWYYSLLVSLTIYTGAFQFVLTTLLSAGASIITIAVTAFFMNSRQTFYSLSFVDDFGSMGLKKPYMIHMDNMERELFIRDADPEDANKLVEIYSYYVLNTAVSFEYEAPSVAEFENRIKTTKEKYPYLVCLLNDRIVGYAYAGPYSLREAYNWTATTSIYVDKDYRSQGIGSLLYKELEKRLKEQDIVNLLAGVAYNDEEDEYLTHDSYKFHIRSGYTKAAHMKTIGKKFDRWYDLIWMQKKLQKVG